MGVGITPAPWDCAATRLCLSGTAPIIYNNITGNFSVDLAGIWPIQYAIVGVQGQFSLAAAVWGLRSHTRIIGTSNVAHPSLDQIRVDALCNGVADDIIINAQIAIVAAAGGGTVYLSDGTYVLANPIIMLADVQLIGTGRSSFIDGDGLLTGNHAIVISAVTGCKVMNLAIQTQDGGGKVCHCIFIEDGANNFVIEYVVIVDSDSDGIHIEGTTIVEGHIHSCHIEGADGYCIIASMDNGQSMLRLHIAGSFITWAGLAGIALWNGAGVGNSQYCTITGNVIYLCGGEGIIAWDSDYCIMGGNISLLNGGWGIRVRDSEHVNLSNNIASNNGTDGIMLENSDESTVEGNITNVNGFDGIQIEGSGNNVIGNHCCNNVRYGIHVLVTGLSSNVLGNYVHENEQHGIMVRGPRTQVEGNWLFNNGTAAAGTYNGIHVTGSADYSSIVGNYIWADHAVTAFTEDGIYLAHQANFITVQGNYIYDVLGSGIVLENENYYCSIIGNHILEPDDYGIWGVASECEITEVVANHIHRTGLDGIRWEGGYSKLAENYVSRAGQQAAGTYHGIHLGTTAVRCQVNDNYIYSEVNRTEDGICLDNGCADCQITGNYIWSLMGSGIMLTANNSNCLILGNLVEQCDDHGIEVLAGADATSVIDNHVLSCGLHGIYLNDVDSAVVSGNHVYTNGQHGIYLNDTEHALVSGNWSGGNSQAVVVTWDNICIDGNSLYCSVLGNKCLRVDANPRFGLNIAAAGCLQTMVDGNDLYDAGNTADYNNAGTNTLERSNRVTGGWYTSKARTATRIVAASNASDDQWGHGYADYYPDGVADQTEINAAIAYVNAAGGGNVYLSEGTFIISASITMLDNVMLQGTGHGTIIQIAAGVAVGQAIAEAAAAGHIGLMDFSIDGNRANASTGMGVNFTNAPNTFIMGLYIHNTWSGGAFIAGGLGVLMDTCNYSIFMNNWVHNCGSDGFIGPDAGIRIANSGYCIVANNIMTSCTLAGATFTSCTFSSIAGNICQDSAGHGFNMLNCLRCSITRNVSVANSATGFYISSCDYNLLAMNLADFNQTHGINLLASDHNLVSSNLTLRNNQVGGIADNINLNNSDLNLITSNIARYDAASPARYGLSLAANCNDNEVHGNDLYLSGATADLFDSGVRTLERDNRVTEGWYSLPTQLEHWSTRYYSGPTLSYHDATEIIVANQVYALPFVVSKWGTYDRIAICVTAGVVGNCRLAIYRDNNGYPGALILETANMSVNVGAGTVVEANITQILAAGWYWLVLICNCGPTIRSQICRYNTAQQEFGWATGCQNAVYFGGLRGAQAFPVNGLPDPFTVGHTPWSNQDFPRLMLRRQ